MKTIKFKRGRYMIGTVAIHKLGDIGRPNGDLCIVFARKGSNYIGNWVTGFGFVEVKFPTSSTRRLTEAERKRWNGRRVGIAGSWSYKIEV